MYRDLASLKCMFNYDAFCACCKSHAAGLYLRNVGTVLYSEQNKLRNKHDIFCNFF